MAVDEKNIKNMPALNGEDDIRQMLTEQNKLLEQVYKQSKKTARYIMFGRIISFIYLLLVLAPIILAIIYLPPFIEKTMGPYQELLGVEQGASGLGVDEIDDILKQLGR